MHLWICEKHFFYFFLYFMKLLFLLQLPPNFFETLQPWMINNDFSYFFWPLWLSEAVCLSGSYLSTGSEVLHMKRRPLCAFCRGSFKQVSEKQPLVVWLCVRWASPYPLPQGGAASTVLQTLCQLQKVRVRTMVYWRRKRKKQRQQCYTSVLPCVCQSQ